MSWSEEDLVTGPLPLWFQIADRLLADLNDGSFKTGDLLPSESELTNRFEVSRTTARAALDHIASRGLIVRRPGIGSVVCEPPVEETPHAFSSFSEEMIKRGFTPGIAAASVQVEPATALVSKTLGIQKGTSVYRFECTLLADGEPIAASRTWCSPNFISTHLTVDAQAVHERSLYEWIEDVSGATVSHGEETIEANTADRELATQLRVKIGSAILTSRRTSFTASGAGIEYSVRQYRGDRYRYRLDLAGNKS